MIEKYKEGSEKLLSKDQETLATCITRYAFENRLRFSRFQIKQLSDQIVNIFPSEKSGTYYFPKNKHQTAPGGILYNKYNY